MGPRSPPQTVLGSQESLWAPGPPTDTQSWVTGEPVGPRSPHRQFWVTGEPAGPRSPHRYTVLGHRDNMVGSSGPASMSPVYPSAL